MPRLDSFLTNFGCDHLIGMLHAFVLLRPSLTEVLRQKESQLISTLDMNKYGRLAPVGATIESAEVQERMKNLKETIDDAVREMNQAIRSMEEKMLKEKENMENDLQKRT